ncbi:uncharacterized protein LOC135837234 isoform X2 [Planococcus citri]|uniref:uncharacterized protein LOC135837234 isoform X2 n=1 Tax=Planococcus citri TaxID=170843 RepID=UPI0031F88810
MKLVVSVVHLLLINVCSSTNEEQDIDDIMNQDPLTATHCKSNQFDCGRECIDSALVCDGKEDCPGGADEYNEHCVIDHKNASCPYPNLPQQRHEVWLNYSGSGKPNERVPEFVRGVIRCKPGYIGDPENEIVTTCIQRNWEPPAMSCRKTCPEINNPELQQQCFQGNKVDCNGVIWESTLVRFSCQKSNHEPTFAEAYCLPSGKWNLNPSLIECRPVCGHVTREIVEALKRKDFPWRALIREQIDPNQSPRHFSGTLLDRKIVLTDGNLFTRTKNPRHFEIFVNDNIESWGSLKSYKKSLSPESLGSLAILETDEEIEYCLTVLPVCVSPYSYPASSEWFLDIGMMVILGDSEDVISRDEISVMKLNSLEVTCEKNREKCNQYYAQFNETNLGNRQLNDINQGTGLIKTDKELGIYILEGVYSHQHPESSDLLIFTFVSHYVEWIDEIREMIKYNNNVILDETTPSVKQIKDTTPSSPKTSHSHSLLTVFVLLSFVILIGALFRIR